MAKGGGLFDDFAKAFGDGLETLGDFASDAAGALGGLSAAAAAVTSSAGEAIDGLAELGTIAVDVVGYTLGHFGDMLEEITDNKDVAGILGLLGAAAEKVAPIMESIADAAAKVGPAIGAAAGSAASSLSAAFLAAGSALANSGKAAGSMLVEGATAAYEGAKAVAAGMAMIGAAMAATATGVGVVGTAIAGAAMAMVQAPKAALDMLGDSVKGAASAMAAIAGGGIVDLFGSVGGALKQYVSALNPAQAQLFDFVLKDLTAVVGTSLSPVLSVLTGAARETANMLFPVAKMLAPAFSEIASSVWQIAKPAVGIFAEAVRAAVPLFQLFGEAMGALTPIAQAFGSVLQAGLRTLGELASSVFGGGDVKDAMSAFQKGVKSLATVAVIATGALAKMAASAGFAPAQTFLTNLINAAKRGGAAPADAGDTTGLGAATGGRTTSIEGFRSSLLSSAFTASSMGKEPEKKKTEDFLQDAVTILDQINNGNVNAQQWLQDVAKQFASDVIEALNTIIENLGKDTFDRATEVINREAGGTTGGWLTGGGVGGLGAFTRLFGS